MALDILFIESSKLYTGPGTKLSRDSSGVPAPGHWASVAALLQSKNIKTKNKQIQQSKVQL